MSTWSSPNLLRRLPPLLLLLLPAIGLLMVYHPTLASGFERMQMWPDDTVFNHLVMEHSWCWVSGPCSEDGYWNPPFAYPLPNIKATSDQLLSFAPPYWGLRAAGVNPWTSFSLWMMTMSLLNFVVGYLFQRRCFRVTVAGGAFGAFVFAFATPRTGQLNHQQLLPHVFLVLVVWAVARVFDHTASTRRRAAWLYVGAVSLAAQLVGAAYNFEFICVALLLALLWALAFRRSRLLLWSTTRRLWVHALLAAALGGCLAAPALYHYLTAADASMTWDQFMGRAGLPRLASWIHVGEHSWLYGWMSSHAPFADLPGRFEHVLGLGFVTTAVALIGLWMTRDRPGMRLLALVSITGVVLFTVYPGDVTVWPVLFKIIPGMDSIRMPLRIGMLLLIPAAVGLGCWLSRPRQGWRRCALAAAVVVACCAEQAGTTGSFEVAPEYNKTVEIMNRLDPRAQAFVVFPSSGGRPDEAT